MSMRRAYPSPHYQARSTMDSNSTAATQTQEMLEKENDELVHSLKNKVATLKTLAIDMGDEARSHNTYLQGMDADFESTGGLLAGSTKRLKGLAAAGHNRWMCYMILLIVFVFLVLYYVVKWRS